MAETTPVNPKDHNGAYGGDDIDRILRESDEHNSNKNNPHKVTSEQLGLHKVATSGSYNDLTDKPAPQDISGKADKTEVKAVSDRLDGLGLTVQNGMLCVVFNQ